MIKTIVLIGILVLLIGCRANSQECEEAAKIDYGMQNPECSYSTIVSTFPSDCYCNEKVCKEKSCEDKYILDKEFDLK